MAKDKARAPSAKSKKSIMVCVTTQRSCDTLIARGMERAKETSGDIHIVHCVERGRNFMNAALEGDAIEYLFTAAQLAGADMSLLRADSVDDALIEYALSNGINLIILGEGNIQSTRETMGMRLQRRLPDIEFDIVPAK